MTEQTATHLCFFTSLSEVASAAFGGKKEGPGPITEDLSEASPEHFAARVGQMLSF